MIFMGSKKSQKKKAHLVHEYRTNKRAPVWTYLKTKNRDLIRGRKRHWRTTKIGHRIKRKMDKAVLKKKRMKTGTKFKKMKTKKR
jgi:ribosomal protein L39E